MNSKERLIQTNNKISAKVGIGVIFMILGFLIGMMIVNVLSPSKINPKPPIPTNYSLEQKNYESNSLNHRIRNINNGNYDYCTTLLLDNGSILLTKDDKYFLDDKLIDIDINNIWIFYGVNTQYALINTNNNKTILVNVNDFLKPLIKLDKSIQNNIQPVIFNSFINIFFVSENYQQCIKIDTRSFEFKVIKILMNNKPYKVGAVPKIQEGNMYDITDNVVSVIDIKQQKENKDTFNYVTLFTIDSKYNGNILRFNDNNISNELDVHNDINYNIFFATFNGEILMLNKNGIIKNTFKDCRGINNYIFGFSLKEENKINLINLAKSVFSEKAIIFSKEINNSQFAKSFFFVQLNNDLTCSIVIYNQFNSLLDVITLDNNLNQNEIFKIEHVNNFNFDWLENNSSNLQISFRPIVFIFQRDCYYITTPNEKNILLWKNEQLINKYENNWKDNDNYSPFLFELNNVPIIATKSEFIIYDKKFKNETLFTLKDLNVKIIYGKNKNIQMYLFEDSIKGSKASIIYLKSINEK